MDVIEISQEPFDLSWAWWRKTTSSKYYSTSQKSWALSHSRSFFTISSDVGFPFIKYFFLTKCYFKCLFDRKMENLSDERSMIDLFCKASFVLWIHVNCFNSRKSNDFTCYQTWNMMFFWFLSWHELLDL